MTDEGLSTAIVICVAFILCLYFGFTMDDIGQFH